MQQSNEQPAETQDDLFDIYLKLRRDTSESPLIYHRWTLISSVAALLGRQATFPFGGDVIYPNMYVCLMGGAGSRKSSAISSCKKLLAGAGYNTFSREKSSCQKFLKDLGEGFDTISRGPTRVSTEIADLEAELEEIEITNGARDPSNDSPSEVYITAGELEDFLGANDGQFLSLLTNLWDNQDHYSVGKMTENVYIHEPTINLIGGTTPTTFATVFPPEVIGQGMLSRLLLIYGGGARCKITIPPEPDPETISFFVKHLMEIKETIKGHFSHTKEAEEVFDAVYQHDLDLNDNRLESYIARRHVHYYKLCMVLAACELTMVITKEIAIKANTILHWTERLMPKALGAFGRSANSSITQALMEVMAKHPKGVSSFTLFAAIQQDFRDTKEYSELLNKLKLGGELMTTSDGLIHLVRDSKETTLPYVDFNLLQEFHDSKQSGV